MERSKTIGDVLAYFGMRNHGSNYLTLRRRFEHEKIDFSKFNCNFGRGQLKPVRPLSEVLVEHSDFHRTCLKKRLLKEGMLENKCYECGMLPEWNGKPLVMILDHINGVNNDNRIENLRLLCPNCNSQTDTFAGRAKRVSSVTGARDTGSV